MSRVGSKADGLVHPPTVPGRQGLSHAPAPPSGLPPPRPPAPLHLEDRGHRRRAYSVDPAVLARRWRAVGDDDVDPDSAFGGQGRPQAAQGQHNIKVAVRCRPLHTSERQGGGRPIVKVLAGQTVILEDPQLTAADDYLRINKSKERSYIFDEVFDETKDTRQVHERTTCFLIERVVQGFNATVFAYGATGAGKTHTMLGSPAEPGIMMLTLLDLFAEVARQRQERHFDIRCSFLEVYNENIRDLLRPDAEYLDIREDPQKGMCVAGISEVGGLESAEEIMSLLHQANRYRTTEATGANAVSSRSHAVLQVVIEQRDRAGGVVQQVNLGKLSMIDLAGSERASHTNNKGMRMIEGANINRSLLALGNCITALSSGVGGFVPFRDSKMTRLLKDSLGGNCCTVMIANVSPLHFSYEDTHNTLKYAHRAKSIKTKAVRNVVRESRHVSKYKDIIKDLKDEITELNGRLANAPDSVIGIADGEPQAAGEDEEGEASRWKQELMQNFEERVQIKRRLIDLAQEAQSQALQKCQAQVGLSKWESAQVREKSSEETHDDAQECIGDDDEGLEPCTPRPVREVRERVRDLKAHMATSEETTQGLEQLLAENHQQADRLQMELPRRVPDKDMRSFLGLVSRIYVIEVENMDMREMNRVTAPLIHQRDLEAEALRLQIQMRDKIIKEQDELLLADGVELLPKPPDWGHVEARPRPPTVPPPGNSDRLGPPPPLQLPPPAPSEDNYISAAASGFEPLDVLASGRQPAAPHRLQQLQQPHPTPQSGMRKRRALSAGPLHLPPIVRTGLQQGSGEAPPPQTAPIRLQPGNHSNRRSLTTELSGQAAASSEHRPAAQLRSGRGDAYLEESSQRPHEAAAAAAAALAALDNRTQPVGSLLQRRGRKKQRRAEAAIHAKRDRELGERAPPLFLQVQGPGDGGNHNLDVALKQGGLPERKFAGGKGNPQLKKPGGRRSSILS